ncbi:MAG TPA: hypothetical protein VFS00_03490, partial [Polyangiaceae bacterium]|nr:hypothetical protein [Polyangiaceae bacterium]
DRPSLPAFGPPSSSPGSARTPAGGMRARPSGSRRHAANTLDGQVKALGDGLSDSASMPISLSRLPVSQGASLDDAFHYPTAASVSLSVVPPARRRAVSRLALPATMLLVAMGAGASLARHLSGPQAPAAAARAVEGRTAGTGSAVALSPGAPAASASASVKPAASAAPSGLTPAGR